MIKIFTGNCYKAIANVKADCEFPERFKSPWEQIEWFNRYLEDFKKNGIAILTYSPYILNYLNLLIAKGEIDFDNLEVTEYFYDKMNDFDVAKVDLKITDKEKGKKMIDTRSLSEPISYIYDEYNKITKSKKCV